MVDQDLTNYEDEWHADLRVDVLRWWAAETRLDDIVNGLPGLDGRGDQQDLPPDAQTQAALRDRLIRAEHTFGSIVARQLRSSLVGQGLLSSAYAGVVERRLAQLDPALVSEPAIRLSPEPVWVADPEVAAEPELEQEPVELGQEPVEEPETEELAVPKPLPTEVTEELEPAKIESAKIESAKTEPAKTEPAKIESMRDQPVPRTRDASARSVVVPRPIDVLPVEPQAQLQQTHEQRGITPRQWGNLMIAVGMTILVFAVLVALLWL